MRTVTAKLTRQWAIHSAFPSMGDRRAFAAATFAELSRQGIHMTGGRARLAEPVEPYTKTTGPDGTITITQVQA